MTIRSGMQNLVDRLRVLTNSGTAEYTAGSTTYWTDDHLEDVLDRHNRYVTRSPLVWDVEIDAGGSAAYRVASLAWRDLEEAESGTARWIVKDSVGTEIGTADYTADYEAGRIVFSADQSGSAYYLTAYSYDIYSAAADVWEERLAYFHIWYDFQADNQQFTRSQAWDHAKGMVEMMRRRAGSNSITGSVGELTIGGFVRVDL